MKKVGLFVVGFVLAIGLLAGAPGTAKANSLPQAASETILAGDSTTSLVGTYEVIAGARVINRFGTLATWTLEGDDADGFIIGTANITSGKVIFNNDTGRAEFQGNIEGTPFDIFGTISHYSSPDPSTGQYYYSWNIKFSDFSPLSNSQFTTNGTYTGSISIHQAGTSLTGRSSVGSDLSQVPVPPSVLLLAPALFGLVGIRKRLKG